MNKIPLYILSIFIYLGLTKSFSLSETGTEYIKSRFFLPSIFNGAPVAVILTDYYYAGFFIKTYFHKYRVVRGVGNIENVTARVSSDFYQQNLNNIGMSIFRRTGAANMESTLPMPPGTVYLNDTAYGTWIVKNGIKQWEFYRAYRELPEKLFWGDFRPTEHFYKTLKDNYEQNSQPFYGEHNEFGTNGTITKQVDLHPSSVHKKEKVNWKLFLKKYIHAENSKDE